MLKLPQTNIYDLPDALLYGISSAASIETNKIYFFLSKTLFQYKFIFDMLAIKKDIATKL